MPFNFFFNNSFKKAADFNNFGYEILIKVHSGRYIKYVPISSVNCSIVRIHEVISQQ